MSTEAEAALRRHVARLEVFLADEKALTAELIGQRDELVKALTDIGRFMAAIRNDLPLKDTAENHRRMLEAWSVAHDALARAEGGTR